MSNQKEILIKELEDFRKGFYVKACEWFMKEIATISEDYNVYLEDFGVLNIYKINGEENLFSGDPVYDEIWNKIFELEQTLEHEMNYKHLSWVYNEEHKFIH
jgi:hypothetical protein